MNDLLSRIAALAGFTVAQQVAAEFGGQLIMFPRGVGAISEVSAAILAEFNGSNHRELAERHRVSQRVIYSVLARARREAVATALQPGAESAVEVLSAMPVTQLDFLSWSKAVLQAAEKAREQDCLDRLVIALAILPPGHPASAHPSTPAAPAPSPAETPPGTPAPPDTAPHLQEP